MINRLFRAVIPLSCCLFLLLVGLNAGCDGNPSNSSAPASSQPPAAAAASGAPEIGLAFPFPVIELAGSDEQIGGEHGRRLGEAIRSLHTNDLNAYFTSQGQRLL